MGVVNDKLCGESKGAMEQRGDMWEPLSQRDRRERIVWINLTGSC